MVRQFNAEQELMNVAWRQIRFISICASLLLSGCVGWQRNATWDRVTDPDFVPTEQRMQHGYHRTTWSEWSENGYTSGWMRAETQAGEPLPRGRSKSELPSPAARPASPPPAEAAPEVEEGFVPQARLPRPLGRTTKLVKPPRSAIVERLPRISEAAAPTNEAAAENDEELVATQLVEDAEPTEEVAESPLASAWSRRMAALVSQDRKQGWRETAEDGTAEPEYKQDADNVETPVIEQTTHVEAAEAVRVPKLSPAGNGEVRLHTAPADAERADAQSPQPTLPKAAQGAGEVRLKLSKPSS